MNNLARKKTNSIPILGFPRCERLFNSVTPFDRWRLSAIEWIRMEFHHAIFAYRLRWELVHFRFSGFFFWLFFFVPVAPKNRNHFNTRFAVCRSLTWKATSWTTFISLLNATFFSSYETVLFQCQINMPIR